MRGAFIFLCDLIREIWNELGRPSAEHTFRSRSLMLRYSNWGRWQCEICRFLSRRSNFYFFKLKLLYFSPIKPFSLLAGQLCFGLVSKAEHQALFAAYSARHECNPRGATTLSASWHQCYYQLTRWRREPQLLQIPRVVAGSEAKLCESPIYIFILMNLHLVCYACERECVICKCT